MEAFVAALVLAAGWMMLSSSGATSAAARTSAKTGLANAWQYIMVPRFIVEHLDAYPPGYFCTHITGAWPIECHNKWLASQGADALDHVAAAPWDWESHTFPPWLGFENAGRTWSLPEGLARRAAPDLAALLDGYNEWGNHIAVHVLGDNPSAIGNSKALDARRFCLTPGDQLGVCLWPPLAFKNQEHLDAWLAHYQEWRYGWAYGTTDFRTASHDSGEHGVANRAAGAFAERMPPGNPIAKVCATSINAFPKAPTAEELEYFGPMGEVEQISFWRLDINDKNLHQKVRLLYALACIHLAYWERLPFAQGMITGMKLSAAGFGNAFNSAAGQAVIAIAGAAATGGAMTTATALKLGATAAVIVGQELAGRAKLTDTGLPTHPDWEPCVMELTELGPQWPMAPVSSSGSGLGSAAWVMAAYGLQKK